jgi:hypothetical protein
VAAGGDARPSEKAFGAALDELAQVVRRSRRALDAAHAALCYDLDAALGLAWRHDADAPQLLRIEAAPTRWEDEEEAEEEARAPYNGGAGFASNRDQ